MNSLALAPGIVFNCFKFIFISFKLKIFYNLKHRYSVSNMGLVGHNKRFFDLTVGAPPRKILKNLGLLKQILQGQGLPRSWFSRVYI